MRIKTFLTLALLGAPSLKAARLEPFKKELVPKNTPKSALQAAQDDHGRIHTQEDPWSLASEQYPVGTTTHGTVSRITNFGAFIQLPSGREGLVHITEISDKPVATIEDVLDVGEKVDIKVIKINQETGQLALSLRAVSKPSTIPLKSTQPKNFINLGDETLASDLRTIEPSLDKRDQAKPSVQHARILEIDSSSEAHEESGGTERSDEATARY